ncbi:pH-response regulator [Pyrrhoderma noxium]|uniref:PH-response regulator n=1 Tax=Pyrrhoderma noxium TaxID=2282107 RepID=A0A286U976_9AGAM|nr:pH-response regulator [Pyrrhoderma noxium]
MSTVHNALSPLKPQQYKGKSSGIVFGIDVGTTFSGVSYTILRSGETPKVHRVMRYSCQASGDRKIPSIMYYEGTEMKAAGAQAVTNETQLDAEFKGWRKIEHFKMHFRPTGIEICTNDLELSTLPDDLTPTKVMGDFLRYLYTESLEYIRAHHIDVNEILDDIRGRKSFVLSLPNGWTGLPQQRLREAAVIGGLVKNDNEARSKIKLVSEGEASALTCLANGLHTPDLKAGYRFIIADAGGGTLDITSYEITSTSPTFEMKEIAPSDSRFSGSVFVNMRAKIFLQEKLKGTRFLNPGELDVIVDNVFESSTKRIFSDISRAYWLQIGSRGDNDANIGLRMGNLRFDGVDLAKCFEFSVSEAVESIKGQISACGGKPMAIGGFGCSPWLLKQLKEGLRDIGSTVKNPNTNLANAVADGNIFFALQHTVCARYTRTTFGVEYSAVYQMSDPEHRARTQFVVEDPDGALVIPGMYDIIVKKGTEVQVANRHSTAYQRFVDLSDLENDYFIDKIICYSGELPAPTLYKGNEDRFMTACTIKTDTSGLTFKLHKYGRNGKKYWSTKYEIELSFGGPELEARLKLVEKRQAQLAKEGERGTYRDKRKKSTGQWEELRRDVTNDTIHVSGTQAAIKYNAQLTFILTKLPVDIGLDVPCFPALLPSDTPVILRNLAYERAATLFNLAALYSQLAIAEDHAHPDGIKRASAYYQNAAGSLSYLIGSALPALTQSLEVNTRVNELTESFLHSLEYLMLAQAQECVWQKAVMDHLKNGLVAKLAAKVASYYRLSYSSAQESTTSQAFPPEWISHTHAKQLHFEAAAQFRKSIDDVEANKYGLELSRLLEARNLAKKGYDLGRRAYVSRPVLNDVRSLLDILEKNIARAERDNDLIYHHDVPPTSALPVIQDISMVQSVVPAALQDPKAAIGKDNVISGELVGWGAKVAIEIYLDRVRNWVKEEVTNRVTELDSLADSTLRELDLPACLEALDKQVGLPPSLLRKAEEVRLCDGPKSIGTTLESADLMSQRCREILDQAMDILDQEASEDEGIRKNAKKDGRVWDRLPSYEANVGLTNKEKRYRQMLTHAADADETVRSKWEQWEEAITRLTWEDKELEDWVPSTTAKPSKRKDPSQAQTQAHARALRVHLEALDDLRSERAQLASRANWLVDADDVTPRIMRKATAFELWTKVEPVMFEDTLDQEMNKYEKFKDGIEAGADRQVELLDLIRSRHEQFIQSRRQDPFGKLYVTWKRELSSITIFQGSM